MAAVFDGIVAGPWLLLASLRWFGLLLTMPGLPQGTAPLRLKAALAILLGIVMLPTIAAATAPVPLADWLVLAAVELAVGAAIGTALRIMFAGIRLAGELIDQQAGLPATHSAETSGSESAGPSGQAIVWAATAAFLCLPPVGGHLLLTASMLDLFTALPAGSAQTLDASDLLIVLVQRSLDLALRLAAPVLAVASLITIAAGWLGRSCAAWSLAPLEAPVRVVVCLSVLAVTLSGAADVASHTLQGLLESAPGELLIGGVKPQ